MKKFYAFAAAAVAALSMNAQTLYVVGEGEGLSWTPETPMEVTLANDAYTFEVANLTNFKISTTMGDWNTFNGGCKTCNYTADDLGKAVELVAGDGNISTPWKGDYTVTVAGDLSTITMTTNTPKPTGPTLIYLRGEMNEWGAPAEWQFYQLEGDTYQLVCKGETAIQGGVKFKIADADWSAINYGAEGVITTDEELEWNYNAPDGYLDEDFEGTITITLPKVAKEALIVKFESGVFAGVDAIAPAEGEAIYFNLQGVRVANPEKGMYIVRQGDKVMKQVIR